MFTRRSLPLFFVLLACAFGPRTAHATFHLMQIERVIGGVNGDVSAQAIQLRMRGGFQNQIQESRLRVWDAAGANPVVLFDPSGSAPEQPLQGVGVRVLLATQHFTSYTNPPLAPDYLLAGPIPASYLAAGSLTFEDKLGTVYWRVSWGGVNYTGPGTVSSTNDAQLDGTFNPPFNGPLPSTGDIALQTILAAAVGGTSTLADYALSPSPATFTNNASQSANLSLLPDCDVAAGIDLFTTPSGGTTYDDLNLPAGFFGPGSDPFVGTVVLGGQPIASTGPLGPTDTIVKRNSNAILPTPGSSTTVPIEIIALSLVSVNPITVTYNGGQTPDQWSVRACLAQTAPQQVGTMTIRTNTCVCPEGGTFTSTLPVLPKFTFTRTLPSPATQVLDFGVAGLPPIQFNTTNGHWLAFDPGGLGLVRAQNGFRLDHDCNTGTTTKGPYPPSSNFLAGVRVDRCLGGTCQDPVRYRKRLTQEAAAGAAHGILPAQVCPTGDSDGDGICNDADNCPNLSNPLQPDQDDDGVGDGCDNCIAAVNPCQEDGNSNGAGDVCDVAGVEPPPGTAGVQLSAPSPNPATGAVSFSVTLAHEARVRVAVYGLGGQLVRTVVDRALPAGPHGLSWDGRSEGGVRIASGVYYLRLDADGVQRSRKLMVIR